MSRFRPINREIDYLLPPSVQDWLPESHSARYVVEVVEGLDLSKLESAYAGRGSVAYHPTMLLSLLIYGYATGAYSSSKPAMTPWRSALSPATSTRITRHWPASAVATASRKPVPTCSSSGITKAGWKWWYPATGSLANPTTSAWLRLCRR